MPLWALRLPFPRLPLENVKQHSSMNEVLPLSVLIIARNEARYIGRAIASVQFADEIIVIDGGSSDQTREIAVEMGAKVVERDWTGFRDQRNFSLEQASHEWVFSLDADEAATPELASWLGAFFEREANSTERNGFKIRRIEYFLGKEIKGACWNPSYQDRFFRKDKATFVGEIHEYPVVEGGLVRAPRSAPILHNPNVNVEIILEKMIRYTTIEAWDRYQKGERTNFAHMGVTFFSTWWKNYFYYKGYQDGARGFVICVLEGISRTVRHIKLWQIHRMKKEEREDLLLSQEQSIRASALLHRRLESGGKG